MRAESGQPDPLGLEEWDSWFEHLLRAESERGLGTLGPYQLLGEVGRGGQGVVFRARQPGTGRDIAVKRLLAGSLASPAALRRFEREMDAATALNHPGIVAVFGFEFIDGSPLLAMEWVEGEPLTQWAVGKSRAEILAQFLLVCDAVQHAHQRGVLHRDLKPSNVLVDREGRPRVLDFGLAKRTQDTDSTITSSGEFLGTPAYAAPEQWRGEELDVRADVYSLGALLFEMLTRRRLVEGDALAVLAQAEQPRPRPSSLERSIPRELDAVVLGALGSERQTRYQSVDAFSADLRRFLAGEPVLVHAPSAWYQLRKLVARHKLVSVLVASLLLANLVYLRILVRQAGHLSVERDRALNAGLAETAARREAEDKTAALLISKAEEERERARADKEGANAEAVLQFLVEDVIGTVNPKDGGPQVPLVDALRSATAKVHRRFEQDPAGESRVHSTLAEAFYYLGSYAEAEAEARQGLELLQGRADVAPAELADQESILGMALLEHGQLPEAERWLRQALAHREEAPQVDALKLGVSLDNLAGVLSRTGQLDEAAALLERSRDFSSMEGDDLLASLNNQASLLHESGKFAEAIELLESVARQDLPPHKRMIVLFNLGTMYENQGDKGRAEPYFLEAVELGTKSLGAAHPEVASSMTAAARCLSARGEYARALELVEPSERVARATYPGSIEHAQALTTLGIARQHLGNPLQARAPLEEATEIFRKDEGPAPLWESSAVPLAEVLLEDGKHEASEALLEELSRYWSGRADPSHGRRYAWLAVQRARIAAARGQDDEAARLFEDGIEKYSAPGSEDSQANTMERYAAFLRSIGELEGAAALEAEAAEVRK